MHRIVGLFWFLMWIMSEFISVGTTIMLIAQTDMTILVVLACCAAYFVNGQIYANKTRPEMNRAYGLFGSEVGQTEGELISGATQIRAMQTQKYALDTYNLNQNYNTLANMIVMGGY